MSEIIGVRAISNGKYTFTVKTKDKSKGNCVYDKFDIVIDCCPEYMSLEQVERNSWIKKEYKELITPGIIEWINSTRYDPHDRNESRKTRIHARNYKILHAKKNFNFSKLEL